MAKQIDEKPTITIKELGILDSWHSNFPPEDDIKYWELILFISAILVKEIKLNLISLDFKFVNWLNH